MIWKGCVHATHLVVNVHSIVAVFRALWGGRQSNTVYTVCLRTSNFSDSALLLEFRVFAISARPRDAHVNYHLYTLVT